MVVGGVRLAVSYDGSKFAGWAKQPGQRTVQGTLEEAVEGLTGRARTVFGCSRTDAGVHALGQIASFDVARELPMHGWVRALNGRLPEDIVVRDAEACAADYNPRFDSLGKTYRYLIHRGLTRDPLLQNRAWHLGPRRARPVPGGPRHYEELLDVEAMVEAATRFVGTHDFCAFQSSRDYRDNTVRTLREVRLDVDAELITVTIRGNAFLQHMVRIIIGTLVDVGRERMRPDDVAALLGEGVRDGAGETAPPGGLYLVSIELGRMALEGTDANPFPPPGD